MTWVPETTRTRQAARHRSSIKCTAQKLSLVKVIATAKYSKYFIVAVFQSFYCFYIYQLNAVYIVVNRVLSLYIVDNLVDFSK